ncbi:MAG: metallophosphoesterase, partial [Bdellovibrionota bacterium]
EVFQHEIPATVDTLFYRASLDTVPCGQDQWTYKVPRMHHAVSLPVIPCATDQDFRFSWISDTQEFPEKARMTVERMAKFDSRFLVHSGDHVQTGDKYSEWLSYAWAMEPVASTWVSIPAIGNHEYRYDSDVKMWRWMFGADARESHYWVDAGPVRFFVLNTCFADDPSLIERELTWLKSALALPAAGPDPLWKVIVTHHPPFSQGFAHAPWAIKKEHLVLQEKFLPVFEEFRVQLVLSGHTHLFERAEFHGIDYMVAGAAGGKMGMFGGFDDPRVLFSKMVRTVSEFVFSSESVASFTVDPDGNHLETWARKR